MKKSNLTSGLNIESLINRYFDGCVVSKVSTIQTLWSGYGEIVRCELIGCEPESVVLKYVKPPSEIDHPRGWSSDAAHQRKIQSYIFEANWYRTWSSRCNNACRVPRSYDVISTNQESIFVLEDLDFSGFSQRVQVPTIQDMQVCLHWLANFHAVFLNMDCATSKAPLWQKGTYWQVETRLDELAVLEDVNLRAAAYYISNKLGECRYKTIVHGDAKLANFCFTKNHQAVAAVDFQYVGAGCGMQDVMLLFSSGLSAHDCERYASELLDFYFDSLHEALANSVSDVDAASLESEWRELYKFAWADYVRFLKGWSPGHSRINAYSRALTNDALRSLNIEVL